MFKSFFKDLGICYGIILAIIAALVILNFIAMNVIASTVFMIILFCVFAFMILQVSFKQDL